MIVGALLLLAALADLEPSVTLPASGNPTLAVELRDRADTNRRYSIARVPAPTDCTLRLERLTMHDAVLACVGEKMDIHPHLKFVFDPRAKALVRHITYMPYAFTGKGLVATNGVHTVKVVVEPGDEPSFRIQAAPHQEERRWVADFTQPAGLPPLPQSGYDDFARRRAERVKDGYERGSTMLEEVVGPHVEAEGVLWFGKAFYDGEGHTGVGGLGYYDRAARRYTLFAPEELAPWSVSAIAVTPEAVWLGLVHNGEWGPSGGGLLRYDRASGTARRFASPDIPRWITVEGGRVMAATDFGLTFIEGERQRRFFVDETSDGRLRVAEAIR
ncbi:MAG: hypothetical protein IT162_08485 [Bryobacterales bacterium]|nr:hypothetical protein [Bryobacterales bacterium]